VVEELNKGQPVPDGVTLTADTMSYLMEHPELTKELDAVRQHDGPGRDAHLAG